MDKITIERINKEISDYFGEITLHAEEYKKSKKSAWCCDLTLIEEWESGKPFTLTPEALRDAVAAYVFYRHPEVQTISYGGVYYDRESILCAIFRNQKPRET